MKWERSKQREMCAALTISNLNDVGLFCTKLRSYLAEELEKVQR